MKNNELIESLRRFPPDTPVYLFDKDRGGYVDPVVQAEELIAVTEFGCEKLCDPAHAWQYGDARKVKAVTIK